jgi:hypothetical protein
MESKKVKRYRRKVVDLTRKMEFMTNLIMTKDREIDSLKKSVEILSTPDEEDIEDAKQNGERTGEESENRSDSTGSTGNQESIEDQENNEG